MTGQGAVTSGTADPVPTSHVRRSDYAAPVADSPRVALKHCWPAACVPSCTLPLSLNPLRPSPPALPVPLPSRSRLSNTDTLLEEASEAAATAAAPRPVAHDVHEALHGRPVLGHRHHLGAELRVRLRVRGKEGNRGNWSACAKGRLSAQTRAAHTQGRTKAGVLGPGTMLTAPRTCASLHQDNARRR